VNFENFKRAKYRDFLKVLLLKGQTGKAFKKYLSKMAFLSIFKRPPLTNHNIYVSKLGE
jgi:hypothetical protein